MLTKKYFVKAIIFLSLIFSFIQIAPAQSEFSLQVVNQSEAEKWRADLRYMAQEMPKYHANLFHSMTREQFDAAVQKLDERIPTLARHQIIVEMMRITAMINDGHSNVYPSRDPKIGFHQLPIKMYFFQDGLFIRSATNENANLVGAKIIKIGNASVEQAHKAVLEIIGKDNEMGADLFAPHLLAMPEVLHALGFSENPDSAKFTIEKQGRQSVIELNQIGLVDTAVWEDDIDKTLMLKEGWTDWRGGREDNAKVLWLKKIEDAFWYEYLPESKTVYVQFNETYNKKDETIEAFSKRLFDFVEANPVERLILDVRHNRGGSGELNKPLLLALIKSKINQRGKFFTIIGRSTFSATQFLINDLEKLTNTIFVGEPSGSKGNAYGDSRKIVLPNSGVTVRVSIYLWLHWSPWDQRQWTAPELTAELTSKDYRLNRDPAMNTIYNYSPQKSLLDILNDALTEAGVDLAVKKYRDYKATPVHHYAYTEESMLQAGQKLLNEKKYDQAITWFQLTAEEHPNSFRPYYALGVAYALSNKREPALESLEKALKLNPKAYEANQWYARVKQSK